MDQSYVLFGNLAQEANVPAEGILSRTLYQDERVKVVLFGFSASQELSEHTASTPVMLHVISGEATVTFGNQVHELGPNAWAHMAANLAHSVRAKTAVTMVLYLLKSGQ
ncbi:MAG: cupin domain-containing protein [Anaerolineae bacterium]|nr:cupin domain-containing protein [Thermoflexales bacterium]MDW8407837.1 cupin domain-containing protein [Anaerolineae bacterium]